MAACVLLLDSESPAWNNDLLLPNDFLFLLRTLLTGINVCISIVQKISIDFLEQM